MTIASRMPSGASLPSASSTAGVVIRWPTLRTNSRLRPGSVSVAAVGRGVAAVRLQRARQRRAALVEASPPGRPASARASWHRPRPCPRHRPRRPNPRGRRSWSARIRAPRRRCPAGSSRPIGWSRSITTSICRPLWRNSRLSPSRPTSCAGSASTGSPPGQVGPATRPPAAPRRSRNALAQAITCAPRAGS